MSSLTQDDDHQSSNVLLSIWECDKVDRRVSKGNKQLWYYGFYGNKYNIWNSTKEWIYLTISGRHRIDRHRGDILPKYQHHFKALKENKLVSIYKRVSNRDLLQTLVHSDEAAISTYLISSKRRKVSGTSSAESKLCWVIS